MIAALIVVKNDPLIEKCLNSIKDIVSDIYVIHDGKCEDNTLDIAKKYNCKIKEEEEINNPELHKVNFLNNFKYDHYILSIDSDEELSKELIEEIKTLKLDKDGYYIPRYSDARKEIDKKKFLRLFKPDKVKLFGFYHQDFQLITKSYDELKNPILHHKVERANNVNWIKLEAKGLIEKNFRYYNYTFFEKIKNRIYLYFKSNILIRILFRAEPNLTKELIKLKYKKPFLDKLRLIRDLIRNTYVFFRVQKIFTKKPLFQPSKDIIEIDLTYRCNLKCVNCCRSCRQAPSDEKEDISIEQIKNFLAQDRKWKIIRLLGGEPTLHKDIIEICNLMLEYSKDKDTIIEFVTNGLNKEILAKIPKGIKIINTSKSSPYQKFFLFNNAPIDNWKYKYADFANGCPACRDVGIGFNYMGFYPCGNAAGIDRVLKLYFGLKELPPLDYSWTKEKSIACRYCGMFGFGSTIRRRKEVISKTWKKIYKKYRGEQL